jgi:hypothetical protein
MASVSIKLENFLIVYSNPCSADGGGMMKFETLLKVGTYVADIWRHDSFQQMSRMVHKGVKRRMQNYETFMPDQPPRYNGPYGNNFENRNLKVPDSSKQLKPAKSKLNEYLTSENIQSAFQLHDTLKKLFTNKK